MMIFEKNSEGLFFSKPLKKYKLGSFLSVGQVEGIAVNKDGIYISNEDFSKFIFSVKQRLYFIPFADICQHFVFVTNTNSGATFATPLFLSILYLTVVQYPPASVPYNRSYAPCWSREHWRCPLQ